MYVLTNEQMREADGYTIKTLGVPALLLMERAGLALADEAEKLCPQGEIVCVCGGGNNGGDGFVCARALKMRGRAVKAVFYAEKTSADCRVNLDKWKACGGEIIESLSETCALVVDCLYGTGFHGLLLGKDKETVCKINELKTRGVKVLSADIPSGINGKNGLLEGVAVMADETLCIGEIKAGALLGDGIDYAGELKRADIGISLPQTKENYAVLLAEKELFSLLPKRKRNTHKGSFGKAAIVAGSVEYTGAAYLAGMACLRSGAGYTALFTPKELLPYYVLKAPEILLKSINDGDRYAFNEENMQELLGYSSIAYGMGMGCSNEVAKGAIWLIKNYTGKLILDADGLNSLARYGGELSQIFKTKKCDVLLTPHIKEFSRLSGKTEEEIQGNILEVSKLFAKETGVNLLLKNAVSVITDGGRCTLNTTGCSGQAKAGSGDVLAGVFAGLCAMGTTAYESGLLGAYLCGKAACLAARDIGEYALTASDTSAYLGKAFLGITENANEYGGQEK